MSAYDQPPLDETTAASGSGSRSSPTGRDRVDPVSLVAGGVLLAVALVVLVERYWVDIDAVVVAGGAVAAAGVAIIVATVLRHLRRD